MKKKAEEREILAEQVRQIYTFAPVGLTAAVINSMLVFFLIRRVFEPRTIGIWFAVMITLTVIRAAVVTRFWILDPPPLAASRWAKRYLTGLAVTGAVWGSLGLLTFHHISAVHQVFIAFVIGGMAAGSVATYSMVKGGYLAFSIPSILPLAIAFYLEHAPFHYAMAIMASLYFFVLAVIANRSYLINRASLLLRFENRDMIKSLKDTRQVLLEEIDAKQRAEAELKAHRDQLEKMVRERTADLIRANKQLKVEIDERRRTEQHLRESEERLAVAERAGGVGVFDADLLTGQVIWTEQMEELFGIPPGRFEGTIESWTKRVHPDDLPRLEAEFQAWVRGRRTQVEYEYRSIRPDGQIRWHAANARLSYGADGTPSRITGTNIDITERKQLEEDITHMAHHDSLTGLPNRLLFRNMLDHELAQANRTRRRIALFFLDLDRFKEVNDTLGHGAGDELLKEVAKRLTAAIRQSDVAARIGGDEFNVMLSDISRTEDITLIGKKILESLRNPVRIAGLDVDATASIGISVYPDDSTEADTLYRYADIAMYHAKMLGRNNFQFYNADINVRSVERVRLESMLRRTVARKELEVYYQPQIDIRTRRIVCAEALVRWRHPERGMLKPKEFISAAEETGFITAIDEYVFRSVCEQLRAWRDAGITPVCITVNLSAREFDDPDLVKRIERTVKETSAPPDCLNLEITETLAMSNIQHTISRLAELSEMGIGIAIDDFGTGYSSLNYLKRLSIQKLKIDQSFIQDIASDPDDRAIIRAVTAMAHNMKIKVIAEGVETEDQLSFLRSTDCDEAQGHLFSEAVPEHEFRELFLAKAEV